MSLENHVNVTFARTTMENYHRQSACNRCFHKYTVLKDPHVLICIVNYPDLRNRHVVPEQHVELVIHPDGICDRYTEVS